MHIVQESEVSASPDGCWITLDLTTEKRNHSLTLTAEAATQLAFEILKAAGNVKPGPDLPQPAPKPPGEPLPSKPRYRSSSKMDAPRHMRSHYPGKCNVCGKHINDGDDIWWLKTGHGKGNSLTWCAAHGDSPAALAGKLH